MHKFTDVTIALERLEAFEERLGVSLEALSAFVHFDDDELKLWVAGEVQLRNGAQLDEDLRVQIEVTAYDPSKRVIGTKSDDHDITLEKSIGFDPFIVRVPLSSPEVSKVRVYPKKG